jgi:hypothetical protein
MTTVIVGGGMAGPLMLGYQGYPALEEAGRETWREPVMRPYEATDPAGRRMGTPPAERPSVERWPPVDGAGAVPEER